MEIKYSVIIPAHNEANNLNELVRRLHLVLKETNKPFEIIIVNDNSTDKSGELLEKLKKNYPELRPIHRHTMPGVGYAQREGFKNVRGDFIITLDGDLSHNPYEIPKFIEALKGYDMVCGSRYVNEGKASMCLSRKLISGSFNFVFRTIIGIPIKDFTSGFRLYKKEIIDRIMPLRSKGFGIYIEIPLKAYLEGFKITEVPITYHVRSKGKSNLNYLKQGPEYMKIALSTLLILIRKNFRIKKI